MSLGCVVGHPQALIHQATLISISIPQSLLPLNNSLNKVRLIGEYKDYKDEREELAYEKRKLSSKVKISYYSTNKIPKK